MTPEALFNQFSQKKIIVLGDIMIDAYIHGNVERVSPEAPVPIVNFTKSENRLGGAANVALNLVSLGAKVTINAIIGTDKEASILQHLLNDNHISTEGLIQSSERITTIKTRVLGNHQQLLRIDQEHTHDISKKEEDAVLKKLENLLQQGYDAIIFQDYNKGLLTQSLIEKSIALAQKYKVVTTVDPKLKNFMTYKGVTLFKPNLKELGEGTRTKLDFEKDRKSFELAIKTLQAQLHAEIIFTTMSAHGVFIDNGKENYHIPAHIRNITDVSGAGDTVISVATLCLACGLSLKNIAEFANLAGGIVCEYRGVVAINSDRLLEESNQIQIDVVE
ncbi:MAG: D-glycero-beta-D-manno-heptose-7-phosphate kinase [Brumimicrobium sp.]|nr:D-glycero-beta-D-manno-heptose-7-phosphate kinase [Brumimicrobium sp.]